MKYFSRFFAFNSYFISFSHGSKRNNSMIYGVIFSSMNFADAIRDSYVSSSVAVFLRLLVAMCPAQLPLLSQLVLFLVAMVVCVVAMVLAS